MRFAGALVLGTALLFSGCKRGANVTKEAPATLVVRESSQGLLFTWVDENGKFGTEQAAKDVPDKGRDLVRVRDPSQEEDGEHITLADLRSAQADGTYPTRIAMRAEFDEIVRTRRAKSGGKTLEATSSTSIALGTGSPVPSGAPGAPGSVGAVGGTEVAANKQVIIYGASWCGACHEAAAWMKRKKIDFVEKDIEADSSANREMKAKLAKIGKRGGSIPVIDVKGTILVGFSAPAIERAL